MGCQHGIDPGWWIYFFFNQLLTYLSRIRAFSIFMGEVQPFPAGGGMNRFSIFL
jgi:hypothetical protein